MAYASPIDVVFDDDLLRLQDWLANFAAETIAPLAANEEEESDAAFDAMRRALGASGILGEMVTSAYGGKRKTLSLRAMCLVREKLAEVSALADLIFVMQGLGSLPLQRGGSDALKSTWLPRVVSGDAIAAIALTEELAGSDVAALATTAREDGDAFVLDGEKWFISNAGHADFYSVFATVDREAGRRGITCFLVEADRPGCFVKRLMPTLAAHPLGVVAFEGCRVPGEHMLGERGRGFALAMETLDTFRATVGAAALTAEAAP